MLDILGQLTIGEAGSITNDNSDYLINNAGVTLGDNTEILLGTNSFITNANADFTLNEDGLVMAVPDDNPLAPRSISWEKFGYDDAEIGAYYTGQGDFLATRYTAGAHFFYADGAASLEIYSNRLKSLVPITLPLFTSSTRPTSVAAGSIIFNTTNNRFQGWNGQEWRDLS